MRSITCTLTFPDGQVLRATASAKTPGEIIRFNFEGDTSRLKPFGERGTLGFFEWYMRGCAANNGGDLEVSSTGDFES